MAYVVVVPKLKCRKCLPGDEMILTSSGPRPISDIGVGDLVLTHTGHYKPVTRIFSRKYDGVLFNVNDVRMTPEHPVLSRIQSHSGGTRTLLQYMWVEAKDLHTKLGSGDMRHRKQHLVSFPRINHIEDKISYETEVLWYGHQKKFSLPVNSELMTVIGYYLAEGTIGSSKYRQNSIVIFSFGKTLLEYQYASELMMSLKSLGFSVYMLMTMFGLSVRVNSVKLARFIATNFGKGASKKFVPVWVKYLPPEKLSFLFDAYINGDGHRRGGIGDASTVSVSLAYDIRDVSLKLGYSCYVYLKTPAGQEMIQNRTVSTRAQYRIKFSMGRNSSRVDHDGMLTRIKKFSQENYNGLVYNLSVADDDSFTTLKFSVHNCGHAWVPRMTKTKDDAECPKCKNNPFTPYIYNVKKK